MAWVATKHLRRFANGFAAKVTEIFAKKTDVHNGSLKIQKNGKTVKTFSANQEDDVTADIEVPEAGSDTPRAAGTAAAGTSEKYSREDHVHPQQETVTGNAGTATKLATSRKINGVAFDGSKDITVADGTKVPLSGGKMTGDLVMKNVTLTDGKHERTVIVIYDDGDGDNDYGSEIAIGADGNLFIGSGESYKQLRAALQSAVGPGESYSRTSENAYFSADTAMFFYSNCNTIEERKCFAFDGSGNLRPLVNEQHSLGTSAISWLNAFIKNITATILTLKDGGQVRRPGKSGSWYQGRDLAMIRQNSAAASQYLPIFSVKTENGSWEIGPYTGNILHLSYITDTDYNAKTNKQTADIQFKPDGTIVASISGKSATTDKWATARNINGMSVQGDANRANYGTCSTAAATAAKTVDCAGYALATGAAITVKFTATNTAANPTLNVNNTGAKPVFYRGAAIAAGYLAANRTYEFRYNGTQWELVGDIDTNTTYTAASATPKAPGTAAVGTSAKYAREDHVHPAQDVSGMALKTGTVPALNSSPTYNTLADFWTAFNNIAKNQSAYTAVMRFKASNSWAPATGWYRAIVSCQNLLANGQYDVTGQIILFDGINVYSGSVTGGRAGTSDLAVVWKAVSTGIEEATDAEIDSIINGTYK